MGGAPLVKVLRTFLTRSHRTTLISFALGACSGHAASNAWQEMSQCDGGRSFSRRIPPYLRMNTIVRLMTHYIGLYASTENEAVFAVLPIC